MSQPQNMSNKIGDNSKHGVNFVGVCVMDKTAFYRHVTACGFEFAAFFFPSQELNEDVHL